MPSSGNLGIVTKRKKSQHNNMCALIRLSLVFFVVISFSASLATVAEAQSVFDRLRQSAEDLTNDIEERVEDVVQDVEGSDETSNSTTPSPDITPAQRPADSGAELNYANLLRLYIAEHRDLLDNEAFAWHYFEIYKAPEARTEACSNLQRDAQNAIRYQELIEREAASFSEEVRAFEDAPTSGVFTTVANIQLEPYDTNRNVFPVSGVTLGYNSSLNASPSCQTLPRPPGTSYAPQRFDVEAVNTPHVTELPMGRAEATALLDRTKLFAIGGVSQTLTGVATVRVRPPPFVAGSPAVTASVEIIGLTAVDPSTNEALYTFSSDLFPTSEESSESAPLLAASESALEMTRSGLMLLMIRDNPEIVTPELATALTRQQIEAEQHYWQVIDGQITRTLQMLSAGSSSTNLNTSRPLFAYEWQLLRQSNPGLAARVLDAFIRANSPWEFYKGEPEYDARLDAYVEASVFSREAIGFPSVQALLSANPGASRLPSAEFLLPELSPVMADILRQAAQAMPDRLRLDFALAAKFDAANGRLLLGTNLTVDEGSPSARPMKLRDREATFANDGDTFESAINTPLPTSARGRFLYNLPQFPELQETRPGLFKSNTATRAWRAMLQSAEGGGATNIGMLRAIALDREVVLSPVDVSREVAERAQEARYGNSPTFPVTGRVVLDVERLDAVMLTGSWAGMSQQRLNSGVLLARVSALEIIDQNGNLISSIDVGGLRSASEVAEERRVAEARVEAAENEAREAEQARVTAQRESLDSADIVGIRIGMPIAEAERITREHMNVGWVAELSPDRPAAEVEEDDRPYRHFRTYISADGTEQIALFSHPDVSDRLLAVTRTLVLPDTASDDAVLSQLMEKYGNDPVVADFSRGGIVWTADIGTARGGSPAPDSVFGRGTCSASIAATYRSNSLNVLEGQPFSREQRPQSASAAARITVRGGQTQRQLGETDWDPSAWSACGPTVLASMRSSNLGKVLSVGMYDLSTYALVYQQVVGGEGTGEVQLAL